MSPAHYRPPDITRCQAVVIKLESQNSLQIHFQVYKVM